MRSASLCCCDRGAQGSCADFRALFMRHSHHCDGRPPCGSAYTGLCLATRVPVARTLSGVGVRPRFPAARVPHPRGPLPGNSVHAVASALGPTRPTSPPAAPLRWALSRGPDETGGGKPAPQQSLPTESKTRRPGPGTAAGRVLPADAPGGPQSGWSGHHVPQALRTRVEQGWGS